MKQSALIPSAMGPALLATCYIFRTRPDGYTYPSIIIKIELGGIVNWGDLFKAIQAQAPSFLDIDAPLRCWVVPDSLIEVIDVASVALRGYQLH
jgi:hypothetical protein